ncbi:MAG: membrane dipeptidase [Planctomycetes bacterium]|nr:membrane dipeptidase [Planctomycetota bacterium]
MRLTNWSRYFSTIFFSAVTTLSSIPIFAQDAKDRFTVSEQAMAIHRRGYVFDGHNDLPWELRTKAPRLFEDFDLRTAQPKLHTDIPRLKAGNVGAQFWSVYVPVDTIAAGNAFQTTCEQIGLVKKLVDRYPDIFELAYDAEDIDRVRAAGKIASLIGMEGGHSIEGSIGKLRQLYELGARYMTLTHADTLEWADSATDTPKSDGLSEFGEEIVREMNRLGMLVDLSHVSPATMHDALRVASMPVIFSHSSAKGVADHPRNVPDDVLAKLPENGGVVLINFFSGFVVPESAAVLQDMAAVRRELRRKYPGSREDQDRELKQWQATHPYPAGDAEIIVDHIERVIKIAGIDHVGLGSDFDGISKLPVGMEDVSKYPVITELMLRRGYDEVSIHKVLYGNFLRVLRKATSAKK